MRIITFKISEFEDVDDSNGSERASEMAEDKKLHAITKLINEKDMEDGILGNCPKLNQLRKLAESSHDDNHRQLSQNWQQQRVFDLKLIRQDRDIPLKAA